MKRILLAAAAALLTSLAAAQVIAPTVDDPQTLENNVAVGIDGATITQDLRVNVPTIFALHLGASYLDFDLEKFLGGTADAGLVCVYGNRDADFGQFGVDLPPDPNTWVAGTRYQFDNQGDWDSDTEPRVEVIRIAGTGTAQAEPVTTWPLVEFADGQLADKDGSVVCYRTFVMQKYTNDTNGWQLQVQLDNDIPGVNLYIQDNTRCTFNNGFGNQAAGGNGVPFVALTEAANEVTLMSDEATTWGFDGTNTPVSCDRADYAGWLDDLIVVAAEIGMETPASDNTSTLTYTLFPLD